MEKFVIPRRFVRIKALQNLYAYTISAQAHKKEAIEKIKKDFEFEPFLHPADQKEPLAKEQEIAISLCAQSIDNKLPLEAFSYKENPKIATSVRKHLFEYLAALHKDQTHLANGFYQSKESIYIDLFYTIELLLAWHKLAKAACCGYRISNHIITNQLAKNSLLEALYNNNHWLKSVYKDGINWTKDQEHVQNWYNTLIEATEAAKICKSDADNGIKFLDWILQHVIFNEGPINDFLAMQDLYWDEHKRMVKKILNHMFTIFSGQAFSLFPTFWDNLEKKWGVEGAFYKHLFTTAIEKSLLYEQLIGKKAEKWDSERILLIDKLILKLALAELLECKDIPFKVSINEYVEIAKWYGTSKSGFFINGLLEGILKEVHKGNLKEIA